MLELVVIMCMIVYEPTEGWWKVNKTVGGQCAFAN